MLWIALQAWSDSGQPVPEASPALAWQALGFTPRVALASDAALMEVSASLRLFGGLRRLLQGLQAATLALVQPGRLHAAPGATSLVALGRLRLRQPWREAARVAPADLPLQVLDAALPHLAVLERLGCQHWQDLRALPRGGVVRRFGQGLLDALDQAYGDRPDCGEWLQLPEVFEDGLELPFAVEHSTGLLFALQRLLQRLQVWLRARQRGVLALRLVWQHDARRGVAPTGELVLRLGQATQDTAHLARLAAEHLARVQWPAPAQALRLESLETVALDLHSHSLLVQEPQRGAGLAQLVERLGARLGGGAVLGWRALDSHVPERMQAWATVAADALTPTLPQRGRAQAGAALAQALPQRGRAQGGDASVRASLQGGRARKAGSTHSPSGGGLGQADLLPTWLLHQPLRLQVQGERPCHEGPLALLVGPQRLELSGWAALTDGQGAAPAEGFVMRDYFIARSPQAGLLWIYRERRPDATHAWFLHGLFA